MRFEMSRREELAVRAMVHLTLSGERVGIAALADALDSTVAFVDQVVAPLARAGWVEVERGREGGCLATVGPTEVTVLEVIEVVDGPGATIRCRTAERDCDLGRPCLLHEAWSCARSELMRVLASTTLIDVVASAPS